MALGTPVVAATAYSANNGTSVSPAYPANIAATDAVLLFVGQKPSTANGGTVTTPTGWTLIDEFLASDNSGGYGTTLGADTGNTNLRVYKWDTPVAGQTGTRSVTLSQNSVSWAFMVRVPAGGGNLSFGSAVGSRTTAPTAGVAFNVALTDGPTATAFRTGDVAVWAMCIPTDVTTPNQFSAHDITATGAVFGTPVELNEPDSGTGNDIGGFSAWDNVDSGSSSTAPTITVTAGGTVTNVRGPFVLVRVRELAAISLDAQPGSFSITGQDADLIYTRALNLDAEVGSFALTGEPAELIKVSQTALDAQPGSFSYTGQDATFLLGRSVDAQPGSYTLSGQAADLVYTRKLAVDAQPGSYTLSGQDATLTYTRKLAVDAQPGSFSYTGQDAALDKTSALELDATAGSFAVTGQAATFDRTYIVAAEAGTFVLTGQSAELTQALLMQADAGSFAMVGEDATLVVVRGDVALDAQPGTFSLSGQAAEFPRTRVLGSDPGAFYASQYVDPGYVEPGYVGGLDASLLVTRILSADSAAFNYAGAPVEFRLGQPYPDPADVRAGVLYGPGGIYVGTMPSGGGSYLRRR